MNPEDPANIWLPEPTNRDDTYAHRGEHTLDWLTRSTISRARACRDFLNTHLALLPDEAQRAFQIAARHRWSSAFFELVLAHIIQLLGAELQVEIANETGKRPDFTARFMDASVIVEAIAPVINKNVGAEARNRIPLLNYIESHLPQGWRVGVSALPDIGPTTSRKEFEQAVSRLFGQSSTPEDGSPVELVAEISTGTIHLRVFPRSSNSASLLWEAPFVTFDNTEMRIRHAIQKKRQQVRRSDMPVLLAIHAAGIASELEDFDQALYGHTFDRYDLTHQLVGTGFHADGEFATIRPTPPTYAGVLAFTDLGFSGGSAPVLYLHPRFRGYLPEALQQLEQRFLDTTANAIRSRAAMATDIMAKLNFVQRNV